MRRVPPPHVEFRGPFTKTADPAPHAAVNHGMGDVLEATVDGATWFTPVRCPLCGAHQKETR
jgi:hypothetical protein